MIMATHSLNGRVRGPFADYLIELGVSGTLFFVFLSGFFFYHIYRREFAYLPFLAKKGKQLLAPFIVMILGAILVAPVISYLFGTTASLEVMASALSYIGTHGYAYTSHWYIPFILLLFCFSPLHIRFLKLGVLPMGTLLVLMFVVSSLVHRPLGNINQLHAVVYLHFFYLLGIFYAKYRERVDLYRNAIIGMGIAVALFAMYQSVYINGHYGNYHKAFWVYNGWDWMVTQKAALCLPLVYFCATLRDGMLSSSLLWCAQLSFGFYFLHEPIQFYTRRLVVRWLNSQGHLVANTWEIGLVVFLSGIAGAFLVIFILRALIGNQRSRMLVGC